MGISWIFSITKIWFFGKKWLKIIIIRKILNIFINRKEKIIWAIYLERYPNINKHIPIVSEDKINKLFEECKKIFPDQGQDI